MLTVSPALQTAGIGRRLLEAAELWVQEYWRSPAMEMRVLSRRAELIDWYIRRGYALTDRREPFPYGDERFGVPKFDDLEFIILTKSLLPTGGVS